MSNQLIRLQSNAESRSDYNTVVQAHCADNPQIASNHLQHKWILKAPPGSQSQFNPWDS